MLLTEEEAKTKWCPHVRHNAGIGDGTFNRGTQNPINEHPHNSGTLCNCIASQCMAWRWRKGSDEVGGIARVNPDDLRPIGYCGLSGEPE